MSRARHAGGGLPHTRDQLLDQADRRVQVGVDGHPGRRPPEDAALGAAGEPGHLPVGLGQHPLDLEHGAQHGSTHLLELDVDLRAHQFLTP
jgi:hypothetical protein